MAPLILGKNLHERGYPDVVFDPSSAFPLWVLGSSGSGKSTLLESMATQALRAPDHPGLTFVDPHGSSVETLLWHIPKHKRDAVIYLNPTDTRIVGFNPLQEIDPHFQDKVASQMVSVFSHRWGSGFQARAQGLLKMTLAALLSYPHANFLHVEQLITEPDFQKKVIPYIHDSLVSKFWTKTFPSWDKMYKNSAIEPVLNKVCGFLSPAMRNVLCQQSTLDMRMVIEQRMIVLCYLSSGELGETESAILGALIFGKEFWTAMSLKRQNPPHYIFYDEAEVTDMLMASALSQARKHYLFITLANQYASQYDKPVLDSLRANASNKIIFRCSVEDSEKLEKEFPDHIQRHHIVDLDNYECYAKLMDTGKPRTMKLRTLPPFGITDPRAKALVLRESRARFGTPQSAIDAKIRRVFTSKKPSA